MTRSPSSLRYFTGKPCVRGHVAERLLSTRQCLECKRENSRREYEQDPAKCRARSLKHHHKNKEQSNARCRAYHVANREKRLVRMAEWKAENKRPLTEVEKQKIKTWRAANPEKVRGYSKKWRDTHRDDFRRMVRVCQAQRRAAEGKFTEADVLRLLTEQASRCKLCGCDIAFGYEVDHIHPLSRGGTNWPTNLQLLCRPCNRRKGAKILLGDAA